MGLSLCRVVNRKGDWMHVVASTEKRAREIALSHEHVRNLTEGSVAVVNEEGRKMAEGLDALLSGTVETRVIRTARVNEAEGKTAPYGWTPIAPFKKGDI